MCGFNRKFNFNSEFDNNSLILCGVIRIHLFQKYSGKYLFKFTPFIREFIDLFKVIC